MWIFWGLVSLVAAVWGTVAWVGVLRTKFEHTRESRVILCATAAVAFGLGWVTVRSFGPGWPAVAHLIVGAVLGVVYFDFLSALVITIWKAVLTLDLDDTIAKLEEEESHIWRRLNALRYGMLQEMVASVPVSSEPARRGPQEQGSEEEMTRLREVVNRWMEEGGMARVRAVKIESWKESYSNMSLDELKKEKSRLKLETPDDPVARGQIEVRRALVELELMARQVRGSGRGTSGYGTGTSASRTDFRAGACASEEELRRQLEEVGRELARVRAEKERFLRGKIRLSWRERNESRKLL